MNSTIDIYLDSKDHFFSRLPYQASMEYFDKCKLEHPELKGEYKAITMRLDYLSKSSGDVIHMQASATDRIERLHLKQLTSHLIAKKLGEMYCNDCSSSVKADNIIFETYQRECSSGERFYCSHNHLIFEQIHTKHRLTNNKD